jgi:hypothetical protein
LYKKIYISWPNTSKYVSFLGQESFWLHRLVLSFYARAWYCVKKNVYAFLKSILKQYFPFSLQRCIVGRSVTRWPYSPVFEVESYGGLFRLDMLSCFEKRRKQFKKPGIWPQNRDFDIFEGSSHNTKWWRHSYFSYMTFLPLNTREVTVALKERPSWLVNSNEGLSFITFLENRYALFFFNTKLMLW